MTANHDDLVLRELAGRYAEISGSEAERERRTLWRDHNSFVHTRPPLYVRGIPWEEIPEVSVVACEDPVLQPHEQWLRRMLYQATVGDDHTFPPYLAVGATLVTPPEGLWGLATHVIASPDAGGAWKNDPPIKELRDAERMVAAHHVVDEEATAQHLTRVQEAVGEALPVVVDRAPAYRMWAADLSSHLGYLRGIDHAMMDMLDNPEWLHGVLAFMRDGILTAQAEAEAVGDWRLCDHENQAMPYARELADPSADPTPVTRKQLWAFCAAQELTLVSPRMHDEFMLQYQLPILKHFGLVAYGCCEDLTRKIDMLRQIPNLRRIAVAPRADVARCAEQIGTDYIFSYRPNPAEMVCCGFDPEHVRTVVRNAMEVSKGCHVDITLKDIQTVEGQPERLREWVRIVRAIADEY
jgi:hypothetical protein